ncbi:MAG: hypothetical protein CL840_00345 [Crocinitomicaceae bacterium]|nr:hypothetical protein [Crocinitomicaceae bacterium]
MKKNLFFLLIFILFLNNGFSQDTIRRYYDADWKEVSNKNAAIYFGKFYKDTNKTWVKKDYYMTSQIQMIGRFKSKKLKVKHGHFIYYHENGEVSLEGDYVEGNREGIWKAFYDNKKPKSEGQYANGDYVGHWKFFHENGELKSEGKYVEDRIHGKWVYYFDNGQVSSMGEYDNGYSIKNWIYYHENGIKKASGNYKEGEKIETWNYFYDNGVKQTEEVYEEGKLVSAIGYFKNGSKQFTGVYSNGMAHGEFKYWNPRGRLIQKGNYDQGKLNGTWERYFKDGKLQLYYEDGELLGKKFGGMVRSQ